MIINHTLAPQQQHPTGSLASPAGAEPITQTLKQKPPTESPHYLPKALLLSSISDLGAAEWLGMVFPSRKL